MVRAMRWSYGLHFTVAVVAQASLTIFTWPMRPPVLPPVLWLVLLSAAATGLALMLIMGFAGRRWIVLGIPALTVAVGVVVLLVNTLISGAPIYIS